MASSRRSLLSSLSLLLLVLSPSLTAADEFTNDFSFYPEGARTCLSKSATDAECTGSDISAMNTCLCGNNNNFIINTAKCLGATDPNDVDAVYKTMSQACSDSKTPISVNESKFKDAVKQGQAGGYTTTASGASMTTAYTSKTTVAPSQVVTTTSGGKTVTVTPTVTPEPKDNGGLSTGATIGIGVGAAVIGAAIIAGGVFFWCRRRKRTGEESHPMLPQHGNTAYQGPTTFPPIEPSPSLSGYSSEVKPAWAAGVVQGHSPAPSTKIWESPHGLPPQYTGYAVPPPQQHAQPQVQPQQQQTTGYVFEMEGAVVAPGTQGAAFEMPDSSHYPPQQHQQQQGGWGR